MTTATIETRVARSGRSLEELVDRLMAALFAVNTVNEVTVELSAARSIHEARRLRQSGDIDGALSVLGGVDMARVEMREARWAYSEWKGLVKRRFGERGALVYSQGTGRAAALVPHGDGLMEVVAALGMRWKPGKTVSRRSLRGLRPLRRACSEPVERGGA